MSISLSALEISVLKAMLVSNDNNGGDFGFIEDCRKAVESKASLGGVVASLSKKKIIAVYEPVYNGVEWWSQFDFIMDVEAVKALVE
jgi:hypothetical protein